MAWFYDPILHIIIDKVRKEIVKIIENNHAQSILDICCGTGNQLKYLKKRGYQNITGVDISQSMMKQGRKGEVSVSCEHQDAAHLLFEDDSFDVGIISYALHEKEEHTAHKIVQQARRVIKPNGLLIIVDFNQQEKVNWPVKAGVHFVERFAGKNHYKNFRAYQRYGGLDHLMDYQVPEQDLHYHGGITLLRSYRI